MKAALSSCASRPNRHLQSTQRLLTLDVHDEIDPNTREWVTIDETGRAFIDADEAVAEALGAAFETWLDRQGLQFRSAARAASDQGADQGQCRRAHRFRELAIRSCRHCP